MGLSLFLDGGHAKESITRRDSFRLIISPGLRIDSLRYPIRKRRAGKRASTLGVAKHSDGSGVERVGYELGFHGVLRKMGFTVYSA